jgi:hypothetical protein
MKKAMAIMKKLKETKNLWHDSGELLVCFIAVCI